MKRMTQAEKVFNEIVVEDREEVESIGEMANPVIYQKLKIRLGASYVPIAIYATIFDCIMAYLKEIQATKETLKINIANRLEIGYTTSFDVEENSDMEKLGNFMIYMKHIENNKLTDVDENEPSSVVRCTQWNEANITQSITPIKAITKAATEKLQSRLNIQSANPEIIMPLFCLIHDKVVEYMKLKRAELDVFEHRINMAGCYDVYARILEDGVEISFKPNVYDKLTIKDDGKATKPNE